MRWVASVEGDTVNDVDCGCVVGDVDCVVVKVIQQVMWTVGVL